MATSASAQSWPTRPVKLIAPVSAGIATDVVARLLAVPMGQVLGQSVLVENTVGAGGTIAPNRVAKAKADGYTILIHHMGMATAPALYKKLPYDPLKDFEYIGQVLDVPMTLLSRKDFPANNFAELLDYVKKNQEKVSLANAGIGAVSQLCGMLFMHQAGVKLTTVPYKGAGGGRCVNEAAAERSGALHGLSPVHFGGSGRRSVVAPFPWIRRPGPARKLSQKLSQAGAARAASARSATAALQRPGRGRPAGHRHRRSVAAPWP
jgi:hypothetical protein